MVKYKKIFIDYWGYTIADFIPCFYCGTNSVDIHHLIFKSQCGKDEIGNLYPLCREHHEMAHSLPNFNNFLRKDLQNRIKIHEKRINP